MENTFKQCCVNITRNCNMKCKWCYLNKEIPGSGDIPSISTDTYKHLIDLISPLNLDAFNIIWGEPTVSPNLTNFIKTAKDYGLKYVSITTNWIKLYEEKYIKDLKDSGLDAIHFSLKAWDDLSMRKTTEYHSFENVKIALENCKKYDFEFSIFIVLSKWDIDDIVHMTQVAVSAGVDYIGFIAYDEYNPSLKKDEKFFEKNDPNYIIKKFSENYDEINRITQGKFTLYLSYPLCILDEHILNKLIKNKQTASICPIVKRYTITVDCDGSIFPCNVICDKKVLNANIKDFKTSEDLTNWWNNNSNLEIYNKLRRLPSIKCINCKYKEYCGWGCVCQRTNYSYDELIEWKIINAVKDEVFLNKIDHDDIRYKNVYKYNLM